MSFSNETSIYSILNPEANCFLPLYRGSTAKINASAMFNDMMIPMSGPYNFNVAGDHGYDVLPFISILNPHAGIFVTSYIRIFENCAIVTLFTTILIISSFLIHVININSKEDDLSPLDVLKN